MERTVTITKTKSKTDIMNLLFLYIALPHLSESAVFVDLIKEFAKNGHNVKVAVPLIEGTTEGLNKEAGIDVVRFKTDRLTRNKSNIQKGIAYIKLIYQYQRAVKKYYSKEQFDLIIAHSLPPEMGIIIKQLKKRYNSRFYLMLCEYIWQDSVSLGFFSEKNIICKYYKWLEKTLIKSADYIGSPSQGNIDFTLRYYPWAVKKNIHILHYSQYPVETIEQNTDIRSKYNLQEKFVAIYGGNVSIAQKIENVILLAEQCQEYNDILFLLLGRGPDLDRMKKRVEEKKLTNVQFIDFMPKADYIRVLSVCDVGLVSLNEKLAIPNIPSKTLSYFSLKIPIVASIDQNTDYGKYLETAKAGLYSYAGDIETFKNNLLTLYKSKKLREEMGQNGYNFFINNMTPEVAYNTIINQVKNQ